MPRLKIRLHRLMKDVGGRHFRNGRWLATASDGSRATVPRTLSNELAFCAKNYGKGKTARYRKKKTKGMRRRKNKKAKPQPQGPQMWITLMWQIGLGIPWDWKLGPSNASERALVEMEWSIFAMSVIERIALKEQMRSQKGDPKKLSFAKSLRAIRRSLSRLVLRPPDARGLQELLGTAILDEYKRSGSKAARYKSQKKDKPSCGMPKLVRASPADHKKLKQLDLQNAT